MTLAELPTDGSSIVLFTSSNLTGGDDVAFLVNFQGLECKIVAASPSVSGNSLAVVFSVQDSDDGDCANAKSSSLATFPWWAGLIVGLSVLCCMLLVGVLALALWAYRYAAQKRLSTYSNAKGHQKRFSIASHSRQFDSGVEMHNMTSVERAAELDVQ